MQPMNYAARGKEYAAQFRRRDSSGQSRHHNGTMRLFPAASTDPGGAGRKIINFLSANHCKPSWQIVCAA
eukprot:10323642-Alexandrium_andersonii.AAC.1